MQELGLRHQSLSVSSPGMGSADTVRYNFGAAALCEESLKREETHLTAHGALASQTGQHTGRSAKDKFIVYDSFSKNNVWWENNSAMQTEDFNQLYQDFCTHVEGRDLFVQDLVGGADSDHQLNVRIVTETAWHSLFIRNLLIRPDKKKILFFSPQLTIIDLPSFQANPDKHGCRTQTVIAMDLARSIVLIGGTSYAGEIKKSVFTYLNYVLPPQGVLPMHCAANMHKDGPSAIFFGLSGTGKTTLSADSKRVLIGDDEHGWGKNGVFNFEGGCYAKVIRLSKQEEPEIFSTTRQFGTILENVILDEQAIPDFNDVSLTENTRAAYPISYIPNTSETGTASHPENIIMLTADAFGVLPPVAKLTPSQAIYYFLSGYTAKIAGTEKGVVKPEATFSACFGAPFMPRHPTEYGFLLFDLIKKHNATCWQINTGWTGGAYGVGKRISIKLTRLILNAILNGDFEKAEFSSDTHFNLAIPKSILGVDSALLNPRLAWYDTSEFDKQANRLRQMFSENFEKLKLDNQQAFDQIFSSNPSTE